MVPRILIVEDDRDLAALLQFDLAAAGYSTQTANTGEQGLQKAQRSVPDLVVLDLLLPGMNGFSVCEKLRRNPVTADIPILMITALPGQFPRLVSVEAGANAYLNKPFRMEDLMVCVGDLLRRPGAASGVVNASRGAAPSKAFPALPAVPAALSDTLSVGPRARV